MKMLKNLDVRRENFIKRSSTIAKTNRKWYKKNMEKTFISQIDSYKKATVGSKLHLKILSIYTVYTQKLFIFEFLRKCKIFIS